MKLPSGQLVRSRVISDTRTVLVDALDRELTGYAVLESQGAVLLDGDGRGVLTFDDGIPVVAFHTGTDRGGPSALADLAASGPYHLELYALERAGLARVHESEDFRVPPGMAAERLAGDQSLADRTREHAPSDWRIQPTPGDDEDGSDGRHVGAVEAFLDDEAKIAAIRERAREEAQDRAEEWGFGSAGRT